MKEIVEQLEEKRKAAMLGGGQARHLDGTDRLAAAEEEVPHPDPAQEVFAAEAAALLVRELEVWRHAVDDGPLPRAFLPPRRLQQ